MTHPSDLPRLLGAFSAAQHEVYLHFVEQADLTGALQARQLRDTANLLVCELLDQAAEFQAPWAATTRR